jgi:hypothetical protein
MNRCPNQKIEAMASPSLPNSDNPQQIDGIASEMNLQKPNICWIFWSHPPDSNRRPADYESLSKPKSGDTG